MRWAGSLFKNEPARLKEARLLPAQGVITWGELARLYLGTLFCIILKPTQQSVVSSVEVASPLNKGKPKASCSFCRTARVTKSFNPVYWWASACVVWLKKQQNNKIWMQKSSMKNKMTKTQVSTLQQQAQIQIPNLHGRMTLFRIY